MARKLTRAEVLHTIMHLCHDYHGGQWSRGYRLLCRIDFWFNRRGHAGMLDVPLNRQQLRLYDVLASQYRKGL